MALKQTEVFIQVGLQYHYIHSLPCSLIIHIFTAACNKTSILISWVKTAVSILMILICLVHCVFCCCKLLLVHCFLLLIKNDDNDYDKGSAASSTCSIFCWTSRRAMVIGASSTIFWCRRWMEQSLPNSEMALPYLSASNCTSRWRAFVASFMIKIGEPGTSVWTCQQPAKSQICGGKAPRTVL